MVDSYTAQDTIVFTDYKGEWTITGLATNSTATLAANNELSATDTGFNGNSLGAHNEPGRQRELTLRLVKACSDDKRLNENYNLWKKRDIRFRPLTATFTKRVAHDDGSYDNDTVSCYFGLPAGQPQQLQDTTANTDQVVSEYMIRFGNSERSIN